ncbi:MAG: hypothetical protein L3J07_00445 [Candidatus Magasanikbacteria bacterium]|nr:hypothetical protein [Candidatus Magasanikbacteria bacterium]
MSRLRKGIVKVSTSWKGEVKEKYGKRCVVCGSLKNIEIHHVITRRNYLVKRYIPNGVPLCRDHHSKNCKSAHKNPSWFKEFIIERRGQEWWDDLHEKSKKPKEGG